MCGGADCEASISMISGFIRRRGCLQYDETVERVFRCYSSLSAEWNVCRLVRIVKRMYRRYVVLLGEADVCSMLWKLLS